MRNFYLLAGPGILLFLVELVKYLFILNSDSAEIISMLFYGSFGLLGVIVTYYLILSLIHKLKNVKIISLVLFLVLGLEFSRLIFRMYYLPRGGYILIGQFVMTGTAIIILYSLKNHQHKLFYPIVFFVLLVTYGELAKRLHWPHGITAIMVGYLSLFGLYVARVYYKRIRNKYDDVKQLILFIICTIRPLALGHYLPSGLASNSVMIYYFSMAALLGIYLYEMTVENISEPWEREQPKSYV